MCDPDCGAFGSEVARGHGEKLETGVDSQWPHASRIQSSEHSDPLEGRYQSRDVRLVELRWAREKGEMRQQENASVVSPAQDWY